MQFRFFTIPVHDGGGAADDLNQFLNAHRILAVDRHLLADAANSTWAVCVSFDEGGTARRGALPSPRGPKVDYREVLSEPEFAVFSRLRALRKTLSDQEGVPPYAVFTNEQLARIVQDRIVTITGLRELQGVGASRAEKYGEAFLGMMRDAALPPPTPAPTPDEA
jgi:superfamily II DNA helicase RecQ